VAKINMSICFWAWFCIFKPGLYFVLRYYSDNLQLATVIQDTPLHETCEMSI